MSTIFELQAETRQAFGKGASRRLRRLGNKVPAIMYGGGEPAAALSLDHNRLLKALESEAFYSHILTIEIDGVKHRAVLKDLQRHPYKPRILHMDLLRITGREKINMQVPLHFLGTQAAPGVKEGGVMQHLLSTVEVSCLPDNLPEFIEVDLSALALDESILLSNLKLPAGVELVALMHNNDQTVVSLHIPRATADDVITADATAAAAAASASAGKAPAASAAKDKAKAKAK